MNTPNAAPKLTSASMRGHMKLPPALQGPYAKIVMAGQKIMFSAQMAPQIQALLATQDPIGKKIGDGVAALLGALVDQSHHTLPPQLVIPAGIEFCTDFADLLRQSGMQVSDQDVSVGMETFIATVLGKTGMTPGKLAAVSKGGPGAVAPTANAVPATTQPQAPAGLIAGAQQPQQPATPPTAPGNQGS